MSDCLPAGAYATSYPKMRLSDIENTTPDYWKHFETLVHILGGVMKNKMDMDSYSYSFINPAFFNPGSLAGQSNPPYSTRKINQTPRQKPW